MARFIKLHCGETEHWVNMDLVESFYRNKGYKPNQDETYLTERKPSTYIYFQGGGGIQFQANETPEEIMAKLLEDYPEK